MIEGIDYIGAVGFPIVAYLLLFQKLDKTISGNTKALNVLVDKIGELAESTKKLQKKTKLEGV